MQASVSAGSPVGGVCAAPCAWIHWSILARHDKHVGFFAPILWICAFPEEARKPDLSLWEHLNRRRLIMNSYNFFFKKKNLNEPIRMQYVCWCDCSRTDRQPVRLDDLKRGDELSPLRSVTPPSQGSGMNGNGLTTSFQSDFTQQSGRCTVTHEAAC